ncbi:MAG: tyrosine-type recombinase/integrase, partial [Solirubrobacteraceae bacterium]
LGLWTPERRDRAGSNDEEPTFRELATDWLRARELNPAIRQRTTELNESQLKRYLLPFFGELLPTQITKDKVKNYRDRIHRENGEIRKAAKAGRPLRDPHSGQGLRTLSNDSINKTLLTLAMILDEAEDAGWVDRNVARGRRTREPRERRRNRGALDVDELLSMLQAADQLDHRHRPATLEKAASVRHLRDEVGLEWKTIASRLGVANATAAYLYGCAEDEGAQTGGPRRAVIATLALAGPRVGELCALDNQDISLRQARLHIRDAKTEAGIRSVDIHPRLLDELTTYQANRTAAMAAPAFPTRTGTRRDRSNVLKRIVQPVLARANEIRTERGEAPIRAHVTPHTFRRTYITFMIAAGHDLPYVQAQAGHVDPTTTLGIYAQLMTRRDRDQLRTEIRDLLGAELVNGSERRSAGMRVGQTESTAASLRSAEKAGKGRAAHL